MCAGKKNRLDAAYDAAIADRDALAAELATVYPALAKQLADIVGRIAASDTVIERLNRRLLPDGADRLDSAEAVARGLKGFVSGGVTIPRITEQMRLPAFQYSGRDPYTWPPARR